MNADDEDREALVTRAYNIVTGADGNDWHPDSTLVALFDLFDAASFRRQGPITDATEWEYRSVNASGQIFRTREDTAAWYPPESIQRRRKAGPWEPVS
jgi:hypothetical protein